MKYSAPLRLSFFGLVVALSVPQIVPCQIGGQTKIGTTDDHLATISRLKQSIDPVELNSLGEAYEAVGKKDEAGKAYERSFKESYRATDDALSVWHSSKDGSSFNSLLKSLNRTISTGVASAGAAVRLKRAIMRDNEWRTKASALFYLQKLGSTGEEVLGWSDDQSLKILSKSRPALFGTTCNPGRLPGMAGTVTVVLRVIFHADGKTLWVMPGPKWIKGCNESAMAAAKLIKFDPAIKNGKPVAAFRQIEYSFTVQ